jgi:hypothetical protein
VLEDKNNKELIKVNERLSLGEKLFWQSWLSVPILTDTTLGRQFVIISFPFNQILNTDNVSFQTPSAAKTLRDALPLGPEYVTSVFLV